MLIQKIIVVPDTKKSQDYHFFEELFQKWGFEAHIIKNTEQVLIKYNIVKPKFIILSTDLDIDYKHYLDFLSDKGCQIILYGEKKLPFQLANNKMIRATFSTHIEIDLYQLKNLLSGKNISLNTMLTQSVSNIDMVINDSIAIIELEGNIQFEDFHHLKYHIIHLFELDTIKSIIFIFQYLEGSEENLKANIFHLLSFKKALGIDSHLIKYMSIDPSITNFIKTSDHYANLEEVHSYTEAFFKLQGYDQDINSLGIIITKLNDNESVSENLYNITGKLLKKKGEVFSPQEKEDLMKHGIKNAYPAKDLYLLGKSPIDEYFRKESEKEIIEIAQVDENVEKKHRKNILLIDDDKNILNILTNVLEILNFNSHTASTGVEGFEIATRVNPDLIIVDLMMPGFNGIDFIKTFRETNTQKTPIMVVSAINKKEIITPLIKIGIEDYLLKPLNIKEFAKKVLKTIK